MTGEQYTQKIQALEKKPLDELFKCIKNEYQRYGNKSIKALAKAFKLGQEVHKGQSRESGVPYFTHPLITAIILLPFEPDQNVLISALLHDVFEDSTHGKIKNKVEKIFGKEVVHIIEGVSKIKKLYTTDKTKATEETIRKMFLYAEQDVRILLIKLADRLHNIITLAGKKSPHKRAKKAQETYDIFIPIAARLGLWEFKRHFEYNCFYHLSPNNFKLLKEEVDKHKSKAEELFKEIEDNIVQNITDIVDISKVPYSAFYLFESWQKHYKLPLNQTFYINLVVENEEDCYKLISKLSHLYPCKTEKLKDFIASPKDNGYAALHTTMIVDGMYAIHFHVMSAEMEKRNWGGVTMDIKQQKFKPDLLQGVKALSKVSEKRSSHFIQALKSDILEDKIMVHYKGKEKTYIPKNSTVLDGAFLLFPKESLKIKSLFVNNHKVSFSHLLRNNDVIGAEFEDREVANAKWLPYFNTEHARIKLQLHLKTERRDRKANLGAELLQTELDRYGYGEVYTYLHRHNHIFSKLGIEIAEELFILIAEGLILPSEVLSLKQKKNSTNNLKQTVNKMLKWLFPGIFKMESKIQLTVTGVQDDFVNCSDILSPLYKKHQVIAEKTLTREFPDRTFQSKMVVKAKQKSNLDNFFLGLQDHNHISRISLNLSPALFWQLMSILLITLGVWGVFLMSLFNIVQSHQASIVIYGLIMPVLIANFVAYRFTSNYFPMVRKSKFFLFGIFLLNAAAISLYTAIILIYQLDVLHLSLFFPFSILIISCLAIIYIFLRRQSVYDYILVAKPISKEEWLAIRKKKIMGYSIRFMAVIIWGMEPLYIKYTLTNTVDPSLRIFLKAVGGLIPSILAGLLVVKLIQRKKLSLKLPYNSLFFVIILGELLFTYLMNAGLIYTSSTNIILLNNFSPVIALLIAALLWRDKIPYLKQNKHIIAIFITFILGSLGSTLLFYNDIKFATPSHLYGDFLGTLLMLTDVFLVIAMIKYVQRLKISKSVALNFNIFFCSLLVSAPIALLGSSTIFNLSGAQILFCIGAGVLSGCGRICNFEAFRLIDGFLAFLMFNISIFVTFLVEACILQTIPSTYLLVLGGIMIVGASSIAEYINSKCERMGL